MRDGGRPVGQVGVGALAAEVVQPRREIPERVGHLTGARPRFARRPRRQGFLQQQLAGRLARHDASFIDLAYGATEQVLLKRGEPVLLAAPGPDQGRVQGDQVVDLFRCDRGGVGRVPRADRVRPRSEAHVRGARDQRGEKLVVAAALDHGAVIPAGEGARVDVVDDHRLAESALPRDDEHVVECAASNRSRRSNVRPTEE